MLENVTREETQMSQYQSVGQRKRGTCDNQIMMNAQARVQELVRGGGPKSEILFFFFSIFQGGGPAQKIAEKMIF